MSSRIPKNPCITISRSGIVFIEGTLITLGHIENDQFIPNALLLQVATKYEQAILTPILKGCADLVECQVKARQSK